jgi:hypothetical protein
MSDTPSNVVALRPTAASDDCYSLTGEERARLLPFARMFHANTRTLKAAVGALEGAVLAAQKMGVTEDDFLREARRVWLCYAAIDA